MAKDFNESDELIIMQSAGYPNIQRWVIMTERQAGFTLRARVSGYEVFVFTNGAILDVPITAWQSNAGRTEREEIATQTGNYGAQIVEYFSFDSDELRAAETKFGDLQNKYAAASEAKDRPPTPEPTPEDPNPQPTTRTSEHEGYEIVEDIRSGLFIVPTLGGLTFNSLSEAKAAIDAEISSQQSVPTPTPDPTPGPGRDIGLAGMTWRDYYAEFYEGRGEGLNSNPELVFSQIFTNTIRNFRRGDEENTVEIRTTRFLNDDFLKVVVNPEFTVSFTVSIIGDKGTLSKEQNLFASSDVVLSGGDSMEFDYKDFETGVAKAGIIVNGQQVLDLALMNEYNEGDDVRIVVTLKEVQTTKPAPPDPSPFEEAGVTGGMLLFVIAFVGVLYLANRRRSGESL